MLNWFSSIPNYPSSEDQGIIVAVLSENKEWQIDFRATYWIARSHFPLALKLGDFVRVIGRDGIVLLIEAI